MEKILKLLSEILILIKKIIVELTTLGVEGASQSIDYDLSDIIGPEEPDTTPSTEGSKWIPWLYTAKNLIGTKEIVGSKSNYKIMGWAKNIGGWIGSYYTIRLGKKVFRKLLRA